jgi:hypothetical protein
MTDETQLLRIYCLTAAVALEEAEVERELVARIVATEQETKKLPVYERMSPVQRVVYRAAWRKLHADVEAVMTARGLTPAPLPKRERNGRLKAHQNKLR